MSTVYLAPVSRDDPAERQTAAVDALWRAAGFDAVVEPRDLVAVKLHVGEPGTVTYTRPAIVAAVVRRLHALETQPFLTDSSVLYRSARDNAVGHARVVHDHGFGVEAIGAPFVPCDGLIGADEIEVPIAGGRHHDAVEVASGIVQARGLVVVSHATGHLVCGLGATLKNLGMGCTSRKAKLRQHHGQQPAIDPDSCTACGVCADFCPSDAIAVDDVAAIDDDACIGCGECIAHCRDGAVTFGWGVGGRELQERIAEHALGVLRGKRGKAAFLLVAQGITKDCDCMGLAQPPLLDDIGILASRDPVALDQAVHDLVRARAGRTLEAMSYPAVDATWQLRHAEALGLGERAVELVTLDV